MLLVHPQAYATAQSHLAHVKPHACIAYGSGAPTVDIPGTTAEPHTCATASNARHATMEAAAWKTHACGTHYTWNASAHGSLQR